MTVHKSAIGKYASKVGLGALVLSLPVLAGCVTIDMDGRQRTLGSRNTINNIYDQNGRKVASSMGGHAGGISHRNPQTNETTTIDTPDVIEASGDYCGGYGYGYGRGYWGRWGHSNPVYQSSPHYSIDY